MSDGLVPKPSQLERTERALKQMENELFEEASNVVYSVVAHTFELDPENPKEVPAAWLQEIEDGDLTLEEMGKRQRIALASWQSPKNAPVALQIAAKVLGGMQKARAMEGQGPKHLNLTMVSISAPNQPVPLFPVKEVKHE